MATRTVPGGIAAPAIPSDVELPPTLPKYEPGRILGRSGYISPALDRLGARLRHLDALMVLITAGEGNEFDNFRCCNADIQAAVLELVAHLAESAHETCMELIHADSRTTGDAA